MRRCTIACLFLLLSLASCSGWTVQPLPYIPPTPFPTSTPLIFSPTPIILMPAFTVSVTANSATPTSTFTGTPGLTTSPAVGTPTVTPQPSGTPYPAVDTKILGCNTGLDILHGMGEVTNAYVTIKNVGTQVLSDVCATLNALDEEQVHPGKTKCVASLPAGYQVTLKLTVDTTFKKDSPIQVNVTSMSEELQRVGQDSCTDLGLFGSDNDQVGVVTPIP